MSSVFFYEPFYDFDRFFEEAFSGSSPSRQVATRNGNNGQTDGAVRSFRPRMDLHEDNEKNLVTATFEFPGATKDNVSIDVQNGKLIVSAEVKQSTDKDENGYAVRERRFGKFSRTLQLPQGVKDEEIKASMENGPFYNLDRFFEEAFGPNQVARTGNNKGQRQVEDGAVRSWKPRMDLHEDNEKNLVTATFEFPGVPKEDININVQNGRLTVSAETKQSSEHDENGYAVRERRFGKFSRTLQLPQGVKDEEIKAAMENGVLTVTFPKTAPELAPKKITIN
ncbi:hypothetical protein CVT26_006277 [Gymnopilus dilepis]|uniref:SHSP domain-containing protein n=1 Tax=Gymnopilus dilepis TaxID=231916 RepID=A0A409VYP5_9AGAR|nr:hypothetical protein CVT26_006277 [Gymnopilus dilepis]